MSDHTLIWMYPPGHPAKREQVRRGHFARYAAAGWVKCGPPKQPAAVELPEVPVMPDPDPQPQPQPAATADSNQAATAPIYDGLADALEPIEPRRQPRRSKRQEAE